MPQEPLNLQSMRVIYVSDEAYEYLEQNPDQHLKLYGYCSVERESKKPLNIKLSVHPFRAFIGKR